MAGLQFRQQLAARMNNRILTRCRYEHHYHQSFQSLVFSTIPITEDFDSQFHHKQPNKTNESHVLHQISHLFNLVLPIQPPSLSDSSACIKPPPPPPRPDDFLTPQDKLRGVFLQNLTSVAAIERALTLSSAHVDLSLDLLAKVVDTGNVSAQSMLVFFNWLLKSLYRQCIKPDIATYNIIIKALGRRKFFPFLADVFKLMHSHGVSPDLDTLAIVFDCYVSAGQVSKAIHFFHHLDDIRSQCDTASFNLLLHCLCRRSHVGSAHSLFNSMKAKKKIPFNLATYNALVCGWAKLGAVGEIDKIIKVMVVDGFNPDSSTYTYLLEGLGRANRIDDAVDIFHNMEQQGCTPDTNMYNSMFSNFVSVKEFDKCREYYKNMLNDDLQPNMETYKILIAAFLKVRRVADSLEMFDQMLSKGIVPNTGTVTSFIEPLCNYGPPHAAMVIYKNARKNGCKISLTAYKLLLMRLSRFGKCGMMLSVWNDMQESGFPPDIEVYEHVINGLCNIGQLENAVAVMEESMRRGLCPSRFICSKLNNKLLGLNKVGMAYKLSFKIKNARLAENTRKCWCYNGWHF